MDHVRRERRLSDHTSNMTCWLHFFFHGAIATARFLHKPDETCSATKPVVGDGGAVLLKLILVPSIGKNNHQKVFTTQSHCQLSISFDLGEDLRWSLRLHGILSGKDVVPFRGKECIK